MNTRQLLNGSRRAFLHALVAAPLMAVFRREKRPETLVEINGWILKRSDLA